MHTSLEISEFMDEHERRAATRACFDLLAGLNISPTKIAERIGSDRALVSRWRSGEHCPSPKNLAALIDHTVINLRASLEEITSYLPEIEHFHYVDESGVPATASTAATQELRRHIMLEMLGEVRAMEGTIVAQLVEDLKYRV